MVFDMRGFSYLGGVVVLAFIGACTVVGSVDADDVSGYREWTKVNAEPVYMLPSVSAMCVQRPEYSPANPHLPRHFTVYVNEIGRAAMSAGTVFPVGSIIVKEKFAEGASKPELLTVMLKRAKGFNPECGDWEFRTASPDGDYAATEDVAHCVSCHVAKPDSDFTFRTYVGK